MSKADKAGTNAKQAPSKAQVADIGASCEALCDALHEQSALQARVIRGICRDKLTVGHIAHLTRMPINRVRAEETAAYKSLLGLVTDGAFDQWATPTEDKGAKPLESASQKALDQAGDSEAGGVDPDTGTRTANG